MRALLAFLSIVTRSIILLALLASVPAALGYAIADQAGAVAGAALGILGFLGFAMLAESGLARIEKASPISDLMPGSGLRVLLTPDPSPNLMVARSWLSAGTVMISQGLLASFNESEIQAVMRIASIRARGTGAVLQSMCAMLAAITLKAAPKKWMWKHLNGSSRDSDLGAFSAASFIGFLSVWGLARFLVALGGHSDPIAPEDWNTQSALRKIMHALPVSGSAQNPAAVRLYIRDPWATSRALPLQP